MLSKLIARVQRIEASAGGPSAVLRVRSRDRQRHRRPRACPWASTVRIVIAGEHI
jgi:hypothetical protein